LVPEWRGGKKGESATSFKGKSSIGKRAALSLPEGEGLFYFQHKAGGDERHSGEGVSTSTQKPNVGEASTHLGKDKPRFFKEGSAAKDLRLLREPIEELN